MNDFNLFLVQAIKKEKVFKEILSYGRICIKTATNSKDIRLEVEKVMNHYKEYIDKFNS